MAFGEYENKILFGKTSFTTGVKQTIEVSLLESTKEKMMAEIKTLNLDGVNSNIERSKNADKIIEKNKEMKEIEKLKPKNCDCGLPPNTSK